MRVVRNSIGVTRSRSTPSSNAVDAARLREITHIPRIVWFTLWLVITVAALVAGYRINELPFHLGRAVENGVTRDELVEVITHLAFYAGWPAANMAVGIARQVFADKEG